MGPTPVARRVARWCAAILAVVVLAGCGLVPGPGAELPPANQPAGTPAAGTPAAGSPAAGTPEDAGTSGVAGPLPTPTPPLPTPVPAPVPAPAPVPTSAPSPAPSGTEAIEARIAELVNQARADANLPPLVVDAALTQAARAWTEQMVSNFGLVHDPGLAVPPGARIAGENVAYRTTDPNVGANLHAQFMASQGHRENLLEPTYTIMGIGVVQSGERTWVTERFVG